MARPWQLALGRAMSAACARAGADGRNCGGNASERVAGEDLGEDDPDRWAPSVSDGGAVTGWQAGSRAEMDRGHVEAGRCGGKWPAKPVPF
jgi:hypothetical protein